MRNIGKHLLAIQTIALLTFATGASAQVGGALVGLEPNAAICKNLTTGQTVNMLTADSSWDCQAMGLVVNPGDTVITGGRGVVPAATCSHPVQESGIGGPANTGWPFELANLITMNVAGQITKIGVDRWDKLGLTWAVTLWDIGCNPLASVETESGTGWYYGDIAPVPVSPGDRFYISYLVNVDTGSYLYRDTPSPVNVGAYTVDVATFATPFLCPMEINGPVVSPVDLEVCVPGAGPHGGTECRRGGIVGGVRVSTDEYLGGQP